MLVRGQSVVRENKIRTPVSFGSYIVFSSEGDHFGTVQNDLHSHVGSVVFNWKPKMLNPYVEQITRYIGLDHADLSITVLAHRHFGVPRKHLLQQLHWRNFVFRHCPELGKIRIIFLKITHAPILKGTRGMCPAENAPQEYEPIAGRCTASLLAQAGSQEKQERHDLQYRTSGCSGCASASQAAYLPSMLVSSSVMDRASSGSPVM